MTTQAVDLAPDGSAWFADRIKVVEDQRAADVAEINAQQVAVSILARTVSRLCGEKESLEASLERSRVEVAALRDALLARDEVINDLKARVWSGE